MSNEVNDNNDEWLQLQSDWQSYQPDIIKIRKRIAWVTYRMIAVLVMDVLAFALYIPFLIYWVVPDEYSLAYKLWHIGLLPLFIYGIYWDFKLRLPLFKLENESTKGILECYLKRVKAGVSLGNIGYKFCFALIGFFVIWIVAGFYFDLGEEKLQQPAFIAFGILWISGFAGIMYWYRNKKQKELLRLKELWKEFLD